MLTSRTPARRRRNSTTARRERPICLDFALAPQLRRKWNDSPCNFLSDRALCYLQIILRLQANPEFRRRTEQTREAQRHIRRHGRVTATHQVNAALRDIGVLCYAVARNPHRLNKVLEQYVPGMHRREPPTARDIREVSLPEFVTSNSHGCLVQRDIIAHECGQYPVTMDSLIAAAARALVVGDVLGALKYVSLRDDPPALALRGIAMAQLGEHPRARELLRRAARGFGAHEKLARARCVVAEAEVALAMRDLRGSPRALAVAAATLESHADRANALHARLIAIRRLLLFGRLDEAASALAHLDATNMPPSLRLDEVEALLASGALVVDACRRGLRAGAVWRPLARRPVLFALARARRSVARRRRSECADRTCVWHTSPQRVASIAPARRDRSFARARRATGADRSQRTRLRTHCTTVRAQHSGTVRALGWPGGAHTAWRTRSRCFAAAHRWRSGVAAGAACRWRGLVHIGPCAGARRQPAHDSACARRPRVGGPCALDRSR